MKVYEHYYVHNYQDNKFALLLELSTGIVLVSIQPKSKKKWALMNLKSSKTNVFVWIFHEFKVKNYYTYSANHSKHFEWKAEIKFFY